MEEGIVPGGGVAMLRAASALDDLTLEGDQQIGVNILKRALEEPMRWIAQNAGFEGSIVVQKVRGAKTSAEGFNAQSEVYEDLVKAGVIDPTKVVRTALQNAGSIASLLLTTRSAGGGDSRGEDGGPGGRSAGHGRHGRDVLKLSGHGR